MKTIVIILITIIHFNLTAQTIEEARKALKKIKTIEKIEKLIKKHPTWNISTDKTLLSDSLRFPDIVRSKAGDIVLKQYNTNAPKFIMKILTTEDVELCKVKYIYLNGSSYSKTKIDSIRTIIINRYKTGEDFVKLVNEFTMDKNPTGDLDWFYKGMMVEEFDNAVRNRAKGEIFSVDVDSKKWYYVVLKTHENKIEKALQSVKIQYNKKPTN